MPAHLYGPRNDVNIVEKNCDDDERMASIMRSNSMKSDGFGGAGTAKSFTFSTAAITNTPHLDYNTNYDFADVDGIKKYLDQQQSSIYLHSNGNNMSTSDRNIVAIGYRSHSPRSSISDSSSSIISNSNSNSNSSINNNNYPDQNPGTPFRHTDTADQQNDIVNNNENTDECNDWINSNSRNINAMNRINYVNYMDNNNDYANSNSNDNNQPNRRNNSRTSRRTSSLRVYH